MTANKLDGSGSIRACSAHSHRGRADLCRDQQRFRPVRRLRLPDTRSASRSDERQCHVSHALKPSRRAAAPVRCSLPSIFPACGGVHNEAASPPPALPRLRTPCPALAQTTTGAAKADGKAFGRDKAADAQGAATTTPDANRVPNFGGVPSQSGYLRRPRPDERVKPRARQQQHRIRTMRIPWTAARASRPGSRRIRRAQQCHQRRSALLHERHEH
jgi:hypothetical protein